MYYFLGYLCRELEKRNPKLTLTHSTNVTGKIRPIFDKHTLRVSLNTHLQYIGGLPFQDAQHLMHHATPVMTLHYTKPDAKTHGTNLKTAFEKLSQTTSQDTLEEYSASPEAFFSSSAEASLHSSITHRTKSEFWRVDISGICPGTSCLTGGTSETGQPLAIPDQRCALCKYRITGPQFLPGLTLEANNIMFRLKKNITSIKKLRINLQEAEDINEVNNICMLRNEIATLDNLSNLDWQEWQALIRIISKCNSMLEDKDYNNIRESKPEDNLSAELVFSSHFSLMNSITKGMELYTIATKLQNKEAFYEKQELMNDLLLQTSPSGVFLSLPKEQRLKAGNLFGDLLLSMIPQSDIDQVLAGDKPLSEYPSLYKLLKEEKTYATHKTNDIRVSKGQTIFCISTRKYNETIKY